MAKKVAICGKASDTLHLAPFHDDSWDIWSLNEQYTLPRVDVLFQIHDEKHYLRYLEDMKKLDIPIYLQEKREDLPNSLKYPLAEMLEKYGDYFTNSISYMIAYAIHLGYEEIGLYGVNMTHDSEYGHQKPSCEYFVGIAKGKGAKVHIPAKSDLLKSYYLYGYQTQESDKFIQKCMTRMSFLEKQLAKTNKDIENLQALKYRTEGALQDLKHTLMIYK